MSLYQYLSEVDPSFSAYSLDRQRETVEGFKSSPDLLKQRLNLDEAYKGLDPESQGNFLRLMVESDEPMFHPQPEVADITPPEPPKSQGLLDAYGHGLMSKYYKARATLNLLTLDPQEEQQFRKLAEIETQRSQDAAPSGTLAGAANEVAQVLTPLAAVGTAILAPPTAPYVLPVAGEAIAAFFAADAANETIDHMRSKGYGAVSSLVGGTTAAVAQAVIAAKATQGILHGGRALGTAMRRGIQAGAKAGAALYGADLTQRYITDTLDAWTSNMTDEEAQRFSLLDEKSMSDVLYRLIHAAAIGGVTGAIAAGARKGYHRVTDRVELEFPKENKTLVVPRATGEVIDNLVLRAEKSGNPFGYEDAEFVAAMHPDFPGIFEQSVQDAIDEINNGINEKPPTVEEPQLLPYKPRLLLPMEPAVPIKPPDVVQGHAPEPIPLLPFAGMEFPDGAVAASPDVLQAPIEITPGGRHPETGIPITRKADLGSTPSEKIYPQTRVLVRRPGLLKSNLVPPEFLEQVNLEKAQAEEARRAAEREAAPHTTDEDSPASSEIADISEAIDRGESLGDTIQGLMESGNYADVKRVIHDTTRLYFEDLLEKGKLILPDDISADAILQGISDRTYQEVMESNGKSPEAARGPDKDLFTNPEKFQEVTKDLAPENVALLLKIKEEMQIRKTEASSGAMSRNEIETLVNKVRGRWKNGPEINIVDTVRGTEMANTLGSDRVEGFYRDGVATIVAPKIKNVDHLLRILAHEAIGHHGFPDDLSMLHDPIHQLIRAGDETMTGKVTQVLNANGDLVEPFQEFIAGGKDAKVSDPSFYRELVAVFSEDAPRSYQTWTAQAKGFYRALKFRLKSWLNRHMGTNFSYSFSDMDGIVYDAFRRVTGNSAGDSIVLGRITPGDGRGGEAARTPNVPPSNAVRGPRALHFQQMGAMIMDLVQKARQFAGQIKNIPSEVEILRNMPLNKLAGFSQVKKNVKLHWALDQYPQQATKVMAHQIGVVADYLANHLDPTSIQTLSRGNMWGHIFKLHKNRQRVFGDLSNREIRNQMKSLSRWWNGPKAKTDSRTLFADMMSVILNDAQYVDDAGVVHSALDYFAPSMRAAFQVHMMNNPSFVDSWQRVRQPSFFSDAAASFHTEMAGVERDRAMQEAEFEKGSRFTAWKAGNLFMDSNFGLLRFAKQQLGKGAMFDQFKEDLQKHIYSESTAEEFMKRIDSEVLDKFVGKSAQDRAKFGSWLAHYRIANGGREKTVMVPGPGGPQPETIELFNPKFFNPGTSIQALKHPMYDGLQQSFQRARTALTRVWRDVVIDELRKSGAYTGDMIHMFEGNGEYVTFALAKYFSNHGIETQFGTVSPVLDTFVSTLAKGVELVKLARRMKVNRRAVEIIRSNPNTADLAIEAVKENGRFRPNRYKGKQLLTFFDTGKLKGYYVDSALADGLVSNVDNPTTAAFFDATNKYNNVARALFTTYSTVFLPRNMLMRDPSRLFMNAFTAPGQGFLSAEAGLLKEWLAALFQVDFVRDRGTLDRVYRKEVAYLRKEGISLPGTNPFGSVDTAQERFGKMLSRYNIDTTPYDVQTYQQQGKFKQALLSIYSASGVEALMNRIAHVNEQAELLPKIAGLRYYRQFLDAGITKNKLNQFLREKAGSPAFLVRPQTKQLMDTIFLFMNPFLQGYRTDIKQALAHKNVAVKHALLPLAAGAAATPLVGAGIKYLVEAGILGQNMKNAMQAIPDRDKRSYITVPLAVLANGKVVYLKWSMDETSRLIHGAAYEWFHGADGKDTADFLKDMFDVVTSDLPGLNPLARAGIQGAAVFQGGDPRDPLTGRPILSEASKTAPGIRGSARRFGDWVGSVWNNMFGSFLFRINHTNAAKARKQVIEKIRSNIPIAGGFIRSMIGISNAGIYDQYVTDERQERNRQKFELVLARDYGVKVAQKMDVLHGDSFFSGIYKTLGLGYSDVTEEEILAMARHPDAATRAMQQSIFKIHGMDPRLRKILDAQAGSEAKLRAITDLIRIHQ